MTYWQPAITVSCFAAFLFATPAFAAEPQRSVHYTYDIMDRQLTAKFDSSGGTDGITNTYNGFGDLTSSQVRMGTFTRTLTSVYDCTGRRVQLTHSADNQSFAYAYDALSRLTAVHEGSVVPGCPSATPSGAMLSSFTYSADGLPDRRDDGPGSFADYSWDTAGRLTGQTDDFTGTAPSVGWTFSYNAASQIKREVRTNDAYAWTGAVAVNRNYALNGLNQYTTAGPATFTYDPNGNLTSDGTSSYSYDIENRLVKAVRGTTTTNLVYDPLGRLFRVDRGSDINATSFVYDGDALVAEYNYLGLTARYVHGSNAAADDPLVWYAGSGGASSSKRWLHANHLGSIVAVTDSSGGTPSINRYDEYGIPQTDSSGNNLNTGRFQYTGQAWIGEIGMYHYKARIYSPTLGRFLQTDPIGYNGGINLYAYSLNDPMTFVDFNGEGPVGWIVKLVDEGLKLVRPIYSKKDAVNARRSGKNVLAPTRQKAGQIERAQAGTKTKVQRHDGHRLADGDKGKPHFQTEGQRGHTFYGAIGAAILTGLEYLDRATNPFDHSGLSGCQTLGACSSIPIEEYRLSDSVNSDPITHSSTPNNSNDWSIDAGQITGNRAKGTRICRDGESSPC